MQAAVLAASSVGQRRWCGSAAVVTPEAPGQLAPVAGWRGVHMLLAKHSCKLGACARDLCLPRRGATRSLGPVAQAHRGAATPPSCIWRNKRIGKVVLGPLHHGQRNQEVILGEAALRCRGAVPGRFGTRKRHVFIGFPSSEPARVA